MPARLVPLAVGRTAFAVSEIADSGLVQRLTRGRLWIGLLTPLLVGIVALNVLTLSFNATASRVGQQSDTLKREISALRTKIATNGASNARIQEIAATLGLGVPDPGAITYVHSRPGDAAEAARRISAGEVGSGAGSPQVASTAPATSDPAATSAPVAASSPAAQTVPPPAPATTTAPAPQSAPAAAPSASTGGGQSGGVTP